MQQAVLEEALKVEGKRHRRRTVTPCLRVYFFFAWFGVGALPVGVDAVAQGESPVRERHARWRHGVENID